ncbi:MAG: winged helix-turn-helix transcriptional regulator [Proteobacteria bacterium]|nr:winged helix-turn-helix transcriptional regulator [Pseudomonadota bacterium]
MPRRVKTGRPGLQQMSEHAGEATRLLKALANEKRLMILCMLVEGEHNVGELNARLDLSQSALSQHLAVLREDGLVDARRDAQSVYYSLPRGAARRIIETLHGLYCGTARRAR